MSLINIPYLLQICKMSSINNTHTCEHKVYERQVEKKQIGSWCAYWGIMPIVGRVQNLEAARPTSLFVWAQLIYSLAGIASSSVTWGF